MNRLLTVCLLVLTACFVQTANAGKPKKPVWVIDPGHGAHDWGCGKKPMMEKKITLAVAKEVGRLLREQIPDVQVVYTRETDTYPTLAARAELANRRGAELFVSIHVNEAPASSACGTETFIATTAATKGPSAHKSEMLALLMQKHYLKHGRGTSRGVKRRELYVIEQTSMPSVLTEIGFLSNSSDSLAICSPEGQTVIAQSIVDALKEWRQLTSGGVKRRDLVNMRYAYQDYRVEEEIPIPSRPAQQSSPAQPVSPASDLASTQSSAAITTEIVPSSTASSGTDSSSTASSSTASSATASSSTAPSSGSVVGGSSAEPPSSSSSPSSSSPQLDPTKPYFAIQLMNSSKAIASDDSRLKGVTPVQCIKVGTLYKVITRLSPTYEGARAQLPAIRETFPDAFIVAFLGENQVTVAEARQMLK